MNVRYELLDRLDFSTDEISEVAHYESPGRYLEFMLPDKGWYRLDRATNQFYRVVLEESEQ